MSAVVGNVLMVLWFLVFVYLVEDTVRRGHL
jgi:hypothetical protein